MNEQEGRDRLAAAVRADRGRLYRTVDAARIAARISRGAWDGVENGKRAQAFTYAAIEEALGWPAGRARVILRGLDEPLETDDRDPVEVAIERSSLSRGDKQRLIGTYYDMLDKPTEAGETA